MSTPRKIAQRRPKSDRIADALELLVGEVGALNLRIAREQRARLRGEEKTRELLAEQSAKIDAAAHLISEIHTQIMPADKRKTVKMKAVRE